MSDSMAVKLLTALVFHWLWCYSEVYAESSPIVKVINGSLEGTFMKSRRGKEFSAFRAIPYAQPPIGQLRFEPPKSFGSWEGVRSAQEDADYCPQRNIMFGAEGFLGDEDCLYLNVYTLKLPSTDEEIAHPIYPVMVWFHGGGYLSGSAHSTFYGPKFLIDLDIVFVSVNYRLAALGFLSTEDLVSPGNQGLKDQSLSLRWIQENIAVFGGDPNRVTIFGESAGSACVHFHMLSPVSKGLFQQAITQSGNGLGPWSITRPGRARNTTDRLGKALDCPTDESRALVDCLKTKDAFDIILQDPKFGEFGKYPSIPFRPVIEPDHPGAFLAEEPGKLSKSGQLSDVPWMVGMNSEEGAVVVPAIFGDEEKHYDKILDENFLELMPKFAMYDDTCPPNLLDNMTMSIREFYFGDKKIDVSTRMNLVQVITDCWFSVPIDTAIRDELNVIKSPIYYYYFSYRGSNSLSAIFGDAKRDYGVSHGDDLLYLFPINEVFFDGQAMTQDDEEMVNLMIGLWGNFAKTGNPTPMVTPEIPIEWEPVKTSNLEYLHIRSAKNLTMEASLNQERVNFWKNSPYRDEVKLNLDTPVKDDL